MEKLSPNPEWLDKLKIWNTVTRIYEEENWRQTHWDAEVLEVDKINWIVVCWMVIDTYRTIVYSILDWLNAYIKDLESKDFIVTKKQIKK